MIVTKVAVKIKVPLIYNKTFFIISCNCSIHLSAIELKLESRIIHKRSHFCCSNILVSIFQRCAPFYYRLHKKQFRHFTHDLFESPVILIVRSCHKSYATHGLLCPSVSSQIQIANILIVAVTQYIHKIHLLYPV